MNMPSACSAPGKVLLAGGYLVLDRQYTGLVFGLSARIHVLVTEQASGEGASADRITVQSPQFLDATWEYSYSLLDEEKGVRVLQVSNGTSTHASRNPFVQMTLTYALTLMAACARDKILLHPTNITILADVDYYSHASQPSSIYPRFPNFCVPLSKAHKTGLGSSAALVTALTAALLSHYSPTFNLDNASDLTQLHNLAQAAHCAAQGKVGSGFDVAAAVFGSCIYRRFSPNLLDDVSELYTVGFAERLRAIVLDTNSRWDAEIRKDGVTLPPTWALVMCDVDCGSATVGMVKKVLTWRSENPEKSQEIWGELQQLQQRLLTQLEAGNSENVRQLLENMRNQIRLMSDLSGVPIEPPEQAALLDTVRDKVAGVIGGVVPGAGGYDAIVLLVKNEKAVFDQLTAFFESWTSQKKGNVKLLGTKGEFEGARIENFPSYFTADQ